MVLDEIQRAPDLMLAIKHSVDQDRRPGRFLLTGSANIITAPRMRDSLAAASKASRCGRCYTQRLSAKVPWAFWIGLLTVA
jgi:hypothetical protein